MEGIMQNMAVAADIVMRVPPLFIIDGLLRIEFGFPMDTTEENQIFADFPVTSIPDTVVGSLSYKTTDLQMSVEKCIYQIYLIVILKLFACCLVFAMALGMFMLQTKHLMMVYLYLTSVGLIFISYWSNVSTMTAIINYVDSFESTSIWQDILSLNFTKFLKNGPGYLVIQNYILQAILASIFCCTHLAPRYDVLQTLIIFTFTSPSIMALYPVQTSFLHNAPVLAALLPLAICKFVLWYNYTSIMRVIYNSYRYARNFISNYGLTALIETEWSRLNVPSVLRTFWLLRVAEQLVQILNNHYGEETFTYYLLLRTLLVNGCETLTALLGMTSIVSFICHYVGCFFQWVLLTDHEDEKSFGTISAILFYILALQTGLTSLDRETRLVRLCRNFCLLFVAVLLFVHNIVNPLLMSLSASHNPALHRHLRALAVCGFLIFFASSLLGFLWTHFTISTWLLAVSVFSIEIIVKVLVSLAIYSLFLFVAYRSTFWEHLDDCIYFIRSFGNTVEFAFGIILFFNGFWILLFESSGVIRAVMMIIHAYFNIWCEAKAGWNVFMKRRTAVDKINSLAEATPEQLRTLDDVCAICYQEMSSARITRCRHFFHAVCLRKWLYVQDRCPLCHNILYKVEKQQQSNNVQGTREIDEVLQLGEQGIEQHVEN